ncbi:MAG: DUF1385 domain-containing protein [Chloroflexi bacterium]|nr:DUF1385 domain-containing protein [Chloroflexota bacterium]
MRGRTLLAVAVRKPDGAIITKVEPTGFWGRTPLRRVPLLRGVLILGESLAQGMAALQWSANVALGEEGEELTGRQMALVLAGALVVTAVVFFATPALAAGWTEGFLPPPLVHLVEGGIRIGLLLAYLWLIGRMPDIQRVFAYHGAEHKTIHAFEASVPLTIAEVQRFSPAHPRCGTSFILTVMVVAVLVFALLGQPPLEWRVLSRILLLPLVAGASYEALRFGASHLGSGIVRATVGPGLALQRLTTREPDDAQVEVALASFNALRAAEAQGEPVAAARADEAEINA